MMEHAKPIEPASSTSNEAVSKAATRETTPSLFQLNDEAVESGDLSFSNCSDKPALTLVLPEEAPAATVSDEAADDPTLALVDDDAEDNIADAVQSDDDTTVSDIEDSIESVLLKPTTHAEPVAKPIETQATASPMPAAPSASVFSTAELRPITRPSRFILPDEQPPAVIPAARAELPKPIAPVIAAPAIETSRPVTPVAAVVPPVESASAPEKKAPPPVRVGSGQLQPTRVNWKPGEPFGDSAASSMRFRWELMLTTACGTAACGLAGIWLLRTLLS